MNALPALQATAEAGLQHYLSDKTLDQLASSLSVVGSSTLADAMRYSLLGAGKRIRPVLVLATGQALGAIDGQLLPAASAIECIHAYSLVHDDLPAMDDDDLRRGRPTCHIQFNEAVAILAGDALQTHAFDILAHAELPAPLVVQLCQTLSRTSGALGMCGGQAIDLLAVDSILNQAELENMHRMKTGALIDAAVTLGCQTGLYFQSYTQDEQMQITRYLRQYAQHIGLAFQVQDDILDVVSDTQTLGKAQGADAALNKPTFVSLMGLDAAQDYAHTLHQQAVRCLDKLTSVSGNFSIDTIVLRQLADYIVKRDK